MLIHDAVMLVEPFTEAAQYHRIEIIELLAAHGANVNFKDEKNATPLSVAVERHADDMVEQRRGSLSAVCTSAACMCCCRVKPRTKAVYRH